MPVATLLVLLIQDPTFSFDPRYYAYLMIGLAIFSTSLYRIVSRRYKAESRAWHVASVALAGYTLVSWAKYMSGLSAIAMEVILLVVSIALLISKRSVIVRNYGRSPFGVILLILLGATAPAVLFINALDKPLVVVSPSNPNVSLPAPGSNSTQDAAVGSVYADSWSIYMTAKVLGQPGNSQLLTAYVNNTLGPFEIPFLQKGHELPISLRIISSPRTYNGTYSVVLAYTYQDLLGHQYSGSSTVQVGVGTTKATTLPVYTYGLFGIVGFLAILTIAVILRRLHTPKE